MIPMSNFISHVFELTLNPYFEDFLLPIRIDSLQEKNILMEVMQRRLI